MPENVFMLNMLCLSENTGQQKKHDGFPLFVVLLDIVKLLLNLVKPMPAVAKDKNHKNELKYWRHHQKIFELIALNFFDNNLYEALSEYFYHFVMSFCVAWKQGTNGLMTHL